jgi:hypothetical protein
MKTAMQELKDNSLFTEGEEYIQIVLKKTEWSELLEKEKEQIVKAFDRGYKACDLDEALEINKTMFSGERYYEQTYNQTNVGNDGFEFDNSSTIPPPKTNN